MGHFRNACLAGAAALTGAIAGFLFGIPHTIAAADASARSAGTPPLGNTNLEVVSDWLTKIIVGVGLIQLGRPAGPGRWAATCACRLRPALGFRFRLALVISYAALGFLFGYLWSGRNSLASCGPPMSCAISWPIVTRPRRKPSSWSPSSLIR